MQSTVTDWSEPMIQLLMRKYKFLMNTIHQIPTVSPCILEKFDELFLLDGVQIFQIQLPV